MKKILFSAIALGLCLVSCNKENQPDENKVEPAKVTIKISAADINEQGAILDKSAYTLSSDVGSVIDGAIVIVGTEANPDIEARDVNISVEYKGKTYTDIVPINKCVAGSSTVYNKVVTVGELDVPPPPQFGPESSIVLENATHFSFSVKIAPAEGTSSYAYLVVEEASAKELDAEKLYNLELEGLSSGKLEFGENNTYELLVDGLKKETSYMVYAVAADENGLLGEVSNLLVTTYGEPKNTVLGSYRKTTGDMYDEYIIKYNEAGEPSEIVLNAHNGKKLTTYTKVDITKNADGYSLVIHNDATGMRAVDKIDLSLVDGHISTVSYYDHATKDYMSPQEYVYTDGYLSCLDLYGLIHTGTEDTPLVLYKDGLYMGFSMISSAVSVNYSYGDFKNISNYDYGLIMDMAYEDSNNINMGIFALLGWMGKVSAFVPDGKEENVPDGPLSVSPLSDEEEEIVILTDSNADGYVDIINFSNINGAVHSFGYTYTY